MTLSRTGVPDPLGVTLTQGGVNVAVFSANAAAIDFCLFDTGGLVEVARVPLIDRTGSVFHGFIPDVGEGALYGLRAYGPFAPDQGHRFNPDKLLIDPYALALDRAPGDGKYVPKAMVIDTQNWPSPPVLHIPWDLTIIYELHVRGFTMTLAGVPAELRGTFAGLAHPAAIAHLTALGVTTVELMPAAAWVDEPRLAPLGLTNYWGYNPVAFMAPDPSLAPGGWAEVRAAVGALADAGIETLVDVVFNHTGEGDASGPTLSLRGLDNATYYRLADDDLAAYVNDAGTGNVLALDRAFPLRLAMDALRTWHRLGGVAGFRFDLATVMGRRDGGFEPAAPLFLAIDQDPQLCGLKRIAEPWDLGPDGYQLGAFPATWGEWNDRFRDTVRNFWAGSEVSLGQLAQCLAGSRDSFAGRPVSRSVNFITAHDGFTLADLVAYDGKQNLANGEGGADGSGHERCWNHGVNGPTDDPLIQQARDRDQRAMLATLMVSRGTPMLAMGTELGHSQGGNNNAYAQDNLTSWLDWTINAPPLLEACRRLITLRRDHRALCSDQPLTGEPAADSIYPDVLWHTASGETLTQQQWDDPHGECLVMTLTDASAGTPDRMIVVLSRATDICPVSLAEPRDGYAWQVAFDSIDDLRREEIANAFVVVTPRSVLILAEVPAPQRRPKGTDDALLGRLARAAGISGQWWSLDGRGHEVSVQSQRALLSAMRLSSETSQQALEALNHLALEHDRRPVPTVSMQKADQTGSITLVADLASARRKGPLVVQDPDGQTVTLSVGEGLEGERTCRDGRSVVTTSLALPALPAGRYKVFHEARPEEVGHLTAAPAACYMPIEHRLFGLSAQLYSVSRKGDQGIGDFTTLAQLAAAAAKAGASSLAINPLHALFNADRSRASPYFPSDRRFIDPIYLDVPEAHGGLAAKLIDYPRVWARKLAALEARYANFAGSTAFDQFVVSGGEALRQFATFEALTETYPGRTWMHWPAGVRSPQSATVTAFADAHAGRVRFYQYLQWQCEEQLAAVTSQLGGLSLGICRDLAVGAAGDGAEAWAASHLLAHGVSLGAPPDPLGPEGQIWGLPPFDPHAIRADGYAHFATLLDTNMRHAGALRIDHVMGLARQFWVPDGADGRDGAYVDFPKDDLIAQVTLASHKARCMVIGEDLGTVPAGLREDLQDASILSYRVLPFERDGDRLRPPATYPRLAAACVATHDTPTLAGWWAGRDIIEHESLGLITPIHATTEQQVRRNEKAVLMAAVHEAQIGEPTTNLDRGLSDNEAAAIHAYVATAPSWLILAQLDDLSGETVAVNLPGTDQQRPNWRRRLKTSLDSLFQTPRAIAILSALRRARPLKA